MLVKDRMTSNPITITLDTSFPEAFSILREHKIRHLPVVDKKGNLVGIVPPLEKFILRTAGFLRGTF